MRTLPSRRLYSSSVVTARWIIAPLHEGSLRDPVQYLPGVFVGIADSKTLALVLLSSTLIISSTPHTQRSINMPDVQCTFVFSLASVKQELLTAVLRKQSQDTSQASYLSC